MEHQNGHPSPEFHPLEAVAAWLVPGLGHLLLGQRARGLIIMVTISALWLGGLAIGGAGVVDSVSVESQNTPQGTALVDSFSWWFIGQAMMAPSLAVNWFNREVNHGVRGGASAVIHVKPEDRPFVLPSLGHANEQGTLYTALAGMLNLLAILDVVYCDARERRRRVTAEPTGSAGAPTGALGSAKGAGA